MTKSFKFLVQYIQKFEDHHIIVKDETKIILKKNIKHLFIGQMTSCSLVHYLIKS
jgi:hypothetical protein